MQELENLNDYQKDLSEYIEFGLKLMQNLDIFFEQANVSVKNKLMSSIFKKKIEFDGVKYRTPKFKEVFDYIYKEINELEDVLNKTGDNLSKVSRLVLKAGLEPARTLQSIGF
jgi:site-specific DNA recombinase